LSVFYHLLLFFFQVWCQLQHRKSNHLLAPFYRRMHKNFRYAHNYLFRTCSICVKKLINRAANGSSISWLGHELTWTWTDGVR
jgi:hypothetical protein